MFESLPVKDSKYLHELFRYIKEETEMADEYVHQFVMMCWRKHTDIDFVRLVSDRKDLEDPADSPIVRNLRDELANRESVHNDTLAHVHMQLNDAHRDLEQARHELEMSKSRVTSADISNLAKAFECVQQNRNLGKGYELNTVYRGKILNALENATEAYIKAIKQDEGEKDA